MIFRNNIKFAGAIAFIAVVGICGQASAKENIVTAHHKSVTARTTDQGCNPGLLSTAIDMDINNVRAHLMTGGDMWWDIGEQVAAYEIPKGSGKSSQFAASCWIGGLDKQGQLKVAAQTYRQDGNDYWPGALDNNGKIVRDTCALWDKIWKVDRATINQFIQLSKSHGSTTASTFDVINQWPGVGNTYVSQAGLTGAIGSDGKSKLNLNPTHTYAPFKDLNGDGVYNPDQGEYPLINGDEFLWWVFNDAGNVKQQSQTASMGIEVQTSAFAYATQDFLNNATFYNYRVINRGALTIDSTYIAVWDDCDLGWYLDDFIGCDTSRGLGIQYNGTNDDGGGGGHPVNSYGLNPPQVGLDFFQGPKRLNPLTDSFQQLGMTNFTYYNNDASIIGNPVNGIEIYFYMTGSIRNGQRFSDDFQGPGVQSRGYGSGPNSNFVFWGDPGNAGEWSECACNNSPGDRRFIFSSGPFQLLPGAVNDITFGCIWASGVGGCPQTNFKIIKSIDDQAQALFDNNFKTVEGPEAPRMVIRELDRRLIFYLLNDQNSNNYQENYGRNDKTLTGNYADSLQYHQLALKSKNVSTDSLYKFEGYRVFQLANSQVTSAEIFDQTTGEVDNTKATEVFQCDVKNGVTQIVNYGKNISIPDPNNVFPEIKVTGRDSGIVHSFELTTDAYAKGSDKRFINYHNYYFVAIAYAYNNFKAFDPLNTVSTQDQPYLGSAHAAGGSTIQVIPALPNPANINSGLNNGDMGTILNSDYGQGVVITRLEGKGNGGNDVELDQASEDAAVAHNKVDSAVYVLGKAPIDVKVIDPVTVSAYDWILQIYGPDTSAFGIADTSGWKLTAFKNGVQQDVIYSEDAISTLDEQIIEKYGISVTVHQVRPPGINQSSGNGYITSQIIYNDPNQPWLWGVQDQADSNYANWLRSGKNYSLSNALLNSTSNPCNFKDSHLDSNSAYENMFANLTANQSTWGPYVLAASWVPLKHGGNGTRCGFEVAYSSATQTLANFEKLGDVDLVFTSDMTKWTKCAVIEEQEDNTLSQGGANKFYLRNHASWNMGLDANGGPVYSDTDKGMSYFPGYAIDQGTGRRLNIVFGEDSYLGTENGADMIWNPTYTQFNFYDNSLVFGGKHFVYILNTAYDSDKSFAAIVKSANPSNTNLTSAYIPMQWVGIPTMNPSVPLKSLKDGLIPTQTKLRFRVNRPFASYSAVDTSSLTLSAPLTGHAANPYYSFSTKGLETTLKSDTTNRNRLVDRIYAVPNPYYGYSGYETNRFDTKVRIINLPQKATIYIYSLDGSLIRTLTKDDNTSYIDWDVHNTVGLPIASGMYLMDVKAEGIGEKVLKWFGAMRPIDVTTY